MLVELRIINFPKTLMGVKTHPIIANDQFIKMRDQLRFEVSTALDVGKEVLVSEFGDNLKYVYSKGSAVKDWDSLIDYVPMISDIDIHFTLHDYTHGENS